MLFHLIYSKTQFKYYLLREAFPGCSELVTLSCSMVAVITTWNFDSFMFCASSTISLPIPLECVSQTADFTGLQIIVSQLLEQCLAPG